MSYPNHWRCSCCGSDSRCRCSWEAVDDGFYCGTHGKVVVQQKILAPDSPTPVTEGFYDEDWKEVTTWPMKKLLSH